MKFEARAEGKNVLLTWSTSSEVNSEKFVIERSASGKDWDAIGQIRAQKLSSEQEEYAFYDPNVELKVAYYRLKMVDSDSTFAYSKIESLQFDGSQFAIFPNPVGNDGLLQLPDGANVINIAIFDLSGKKVFEEDDAAKHVNIEKLPAGNYIVRVLLNDGSETSQMVVKK